MKFIILLIFDKKLSKDCSIIYTLIQGLNSYIFIFRILIIFNNNNFNYYRIFIFLINLRLIIKLGIPPFFIWYIKIIKYINWKNIYILSIIQKIIPLYTLNLIFNII